MCLIEVTQAVLQVQVVVVERPAAVVVPERALHILKRLRKVVVAEDRQAIGVPSVHRDLEPVVPGSAERRVERRQADTVARQVRERHERLPELPAGELRIGQTGQAESLRVGVGAQNRAQVRPKAQIFRIELVLVREVAYPDAARARAHIPDVDREVLQQLTLNVDVPLVRERNATGVRIPVRDAAETPRGRIDRGRHERVRIAGVPVEHRGVSQRVRDIVRAAEPAREGNR